MRFGIKEKQCTTPDAFREAAQKLTRLRIDGVDVDPNAVAVDVTADSANSRARFEMEIGCAALHHELHQAGVDIQASDLAAFVEKDLGEHPQDALSGYLEIVRGIHAVESRQGRWRLFARSEPAVILKWSIGRAERVVSSDDRLAIHGVAIQIIG